MAKNINNPAAFWSIIKKLNVFFSTSIWSHWLGSLSRFAASKEVEKKRRMLQSHKWQQLGADFAKK